jgi:hypothetical protein
MISKLKIDLLPTVFPDYSGAAPAASSMPLDSWAMETGDAPIFSYLYKAINSQRHLEFGTWQGWGACLCLESCDATVWTLNLPDGETKSDGQWAYGERVISEGEVASGIVSETYGTDEQGSVTYHRTDAGGYIGHLYRKKGLGHRVCQVYCDSREWDISNYPSDFFDSVLVDGGHQAEVVISDTRKALQVLRPGGIIMWHDFCPLPDIREKFDSVRGVVAGIEQILPELEDQLQTLVWIEPSWILLGIKK